MKRKEATYYSDQFKLKVIQEVLSGKYTKEEARRVYQIGGKSAILYWMRKFGRGYKCYETELRYSDNIDIMKQLSKEELRIKELEKALEKEKLRGDLNEKIIDIAEEQFKIDIRKKFGAKQFTPSKSNKRKQ